jgi:hypothetical protein
MRTPVASRGLVGLILLCWPTFTQATIERLERMASGMTAPIFVTHARGDASRLFIMRA